jgi:hypothetical protein
MRENLIGAAPGTVSSPGSIVLPRTGTCRHENANPQHAVHMPDASDAGML